MARIIDNAVEKFLQPGLNVAFFGWDDRIANGFCGSCNLEVPTPANKYVISRPRIRGKIEVSE